MASNEDAPLWNYVEKLEKARGGGGNWKVKCKLCPIVWTGGGVKACSGIDGTVLRNLTKLHENAEKRKVQMSSAARATSVPLPPIDDNVTKKRRMCDSVIGKSFGNSIRDEMDCRIARMFYSSASAFCLSRNPYYKDVITFATSNNLSGYTSPSYDSLRNEHLIREKENIERNLSSIKASWSRTGVSIVSDGWTDVQRRPLINFMAVSQSGPVFLRAIDASGEFKDASYMSQLFLKVIAEVGVDRVVQLITDNAPVCKAAGAIVEEAHPTVFWTPCIVHTLNLALKNICSPNNTQENAEAYELCVWISKIDDEVRLIRNFVVNHTMANAIFSKFSKLKLLGRAETRFASTIQMLARFKKVKHALEQLVMSEFWKGYKDRASLEKASKIKECIVSDLWWDKVEYILNFTNPIVSMLRECDTDHPTLHLAYEMWDSMIEKVKEVIFKYEEKDVLVGSSLFYNVVERVLMGRWTKSNTPLHCMAHSLNPKYYSEEWLSEGVGRESPHVDREVSINREECFTRLYPNDIERRAIRSEYGRFSGGIGDYGKWHVMCERYSEDPVVWWATNGSSTPLLQALAAKILSQPSSSSCCERNWSTFSHIHTLKRNNLESERVDSLVFVHSNLRLLSRQQKDYKNGASKFWDAMGENVTLEGASTLGDAELYLDDDDDMDPFFDGEES